jgi:hypothetical protein
LKSFSLLHPHLFSLLQEEEQSIVATFLAEEQVGALQYLCLLVLKQVREGNFPQKYEWKAGSETLPHVSPFCELPKQPIK